jgi:hypothetical protein
MYNRVCFTTFDLCQDVPNVCGVCTLRPPVFRYAFSDDESARAEYMKGFCCGSCAVKLLDVLEYTKSQALEKKAERLRSSLKWQQ